MNDLLKEALPYYPNLKPEMIRVVLVHPEEFVLTELGDQPRHPGGSQTTGNFTTEVVVVDG
jgi:hypothetical protein